MRFGAGQVEARSASVGRAGHGDKRTSRPAPADGRRQVGWSGARPGALCCNVPGHRVGGLRQAIINAAQCAGPAPRGHGALACQLAVSCRRPNQRTVGAAGGRVFAGCRHGSCIETPPGHAEGLNNAKIMQFAETAVAAVLSPLTKPRRKYAVSVRAWQNLTPFFYGRAPR
jgi:hypothetical protein